MAWLNQPCWADHAAVATLVEPTGGDTPIERAGTARSKARHSASVTPLGASRYRQVRGAVKGRLECHDGEIGPLDSSTRLSALKGYVLLDTASMRSMMCGSRNRV